MSLFLLGKKGKEKTVPDCAYNRDHSSKDASLIEKDCSFERKIVIYCVKVLGTGCKFCHEQYENTKRAVNKIGLCIEVEYITDIQKIMEYGIMSMPAIVVNEEVVSMGKVLKESEVEKLFRELGF